MRIITVEEHFQHPEVSARVAQLSEPPPKPSICRSTCTRAFPARPYPSSTTRAAGLVRDDVTPPEQAGLPAADTHAIAHTNAEALLRI